MGVFPLAPRSKVPLLSSDEGGHGCLDAATDIEQIRKWWARCPDANVGIATGPKSGIVVVDIDPGHNGDQELWQLEEDHGRLPETVEQLTGGGGRHLIFADPGVRVKGTFVIRRGVDFKGPGGYIAAAPSIHPNGGTYAWEASSRPGEVTIAPLPDWILAMVRAPEPTTVFTKGGGE